MTEGPVNELCSFNLLQQHVPGLSVVLLCVDSLAQTVDEANARDSLAARPVVLRVVLKVIIHLRDAVPEEPVGA